MKDGYRNLMTSVLAQSMTDYIQAVRVGGLDFRGKLARDRIEVDRMKKRDCDTKLLRDIETMTRGEEAKHYIFNNSNHSEKYVFGFKFICTYLGIDPERFREKIKEKREEFWKDIYKKIKEM